MEIVVSTWKNGNQNTVTGAGYGIRIPLDKIELIKDWKAIDMGDSNKSLIKTTQILARTCPEIRSQTIGSYLISIGYHKWKYGKPFSLKLKLIDSKKHKWKLYKYK